MGDGVVVQAGAGQRAGPCAGGLAQGGPVSAHPLEHVLRVGVAGCVVVAEPEPRAPPLRPVRPELLEVDVPIREIPGQCDPDEPLLAGLQQERNAEAGVPGAAGQAGTARRVRGVPLRVGYAGRARQPRRAAGQRPRAQERDELVGVPPLGQCGGPRVVGGEQHLSGARSVVGQRGVLQHDARPTVAAQQPVGVAAVASGVDGVDRGDAVPAGGVLRGGAQGPVQRVAVGVDQPEREHRRRDRAGVDIQRHQRVEGRAGRAEAHASASSC